MATNRKTPEVLATFIKGASFLNTAAKQNLTFKAIIQNAVKLDFLIEWHYNDGTADHVTVVTNLNGTDRKFADVDTAVRVLSKACDQAASIKIDVSTSKLQPPLYTGDPALKAQRDLARAQASKARQTTLVAALAAKQTAIAAYATGTVAQQEYYVQKAAELTVATAHKDYLTALVTALGG